MAKVSSIIYQNGPQKIVVRNTEKGTINRMNTLRTTTIFPQELE